MVSSTKHAAVELAVVVQVAGTPPRAVSAPKPTAGYVVENVICAVLRVRIVPTAEDSFAAIRDRIKFGMAMAAMIRMIATTIKSSIREKPFCFFMMLDILGKFYGARARYTIWQARDQSRKSKPLWFISSYLTDIKWFTENNRIPPPKNAGQIGQ